MCNLSDRIEAKGIEKGRLETLFELVHDGILSVGDAAARVSMPESAFSTEMESYSFSHQ
ncbi:MAG: hypothetical protein J6B68_08200 [Lachnospiraceae bacterium]|nr:hypothetical protein [Lachnospiraceae bacterium]